MKNYIFLSNDLPFFNFEMKAKSKQEAVIAFKEKLSRFLKENGYISSSLVEKHCFLFELTVEENGEFVDHDETVTVCESENITICIE